MKRSLLSVLLLSTLLLTACDSTPAQEPVNPSTPLPEQQSIGLTIVDARGRTVKLPDLPQRIVVAGKSSLTIINTLYLFPEARERIVAVTSGNQKPGDFLAFVDPAFDEKTLLAQDVGPEQIAPLNPDVVILRSFMSETLGKSLEQVDIPVIYVDLETPEQYFRDLVTLSQLLGNEARADEIRTFYQARLDQVAQALQGVQRPSALIVQYSNKGGEVALNVPSASWLQTTEVELAGGVPVWKEAAQSGGWTVVNFEQIAAWDPDKLFVIHYQADAAETADRLGADPKWQALTAVETGEIYGFAADIFSWDQPDPRWILGVTWLADKIHPDALSDLDVLEEVSLFFEQMYGMDEAAVREQILPRLNGDLE